jgi:Ran GTPase-activating protein (RanGAP) involved in mRNA processing and transport
MNISLRDTAILHKITDRPYVVVVQYHNRARAYLSCESMEVARKTIKQHRLIKAVKYIYYNIPELQHIEAYDVRDPERYA